MDSIPKSEILKERDVTIYRITGALTFEKIIKTAKNFYDNELTSNVIYDLTNATFENINNEKVVEVAAFTKKFGHLRPNGKTAIVVSSTSSFGLSRMYEQFAEKKQHPVKHAVFKNMTDAMLWIEDSDN